MAKIAAEFLAPPAPTLTVDAIYTAYVAEKENYDSLGISVGELGEECERKLFYGLRWASRPETLTGQKIRLFDTGNREELRLVSDLEKIGVDVFGEQDRIRLVHGFVRGKCDGKGIGFPEAPKTTHLIEFKSSNDKNFKLLQKKGVKEGKPLHYTQIQIGCHAFGLTRGMYIVTNKNDDFIYQERVEYDIEYCLRLLAKAERVVKAEHLPTRISEKPGFFGCMFCRHKGVCFEDELPRVTCRSCLFVSPVMTGNGDWSCARHNKPLTFDEQKSACANHLYDPIFVNAEQIDSDELAETVTYRLPSGEIWIDGVVA
jgi:hypothetical protein